MSRFVFLFLTTLLIAGCASQDINTTVYPYEINKELITAQPVKKVIIASINLGTPSRSYLKPAAEDIDGMVTKYLEQHGYEVIPSRHFEAAWRIAERSYGQTYDVSTGKLNRKSQARALQEVSNKLKDEFGIDAIVFTDILEVDINFSASSRHYARWHGVTRKPTLKGTNDGVSLDFDWSKSLKGASLWVSLYNTDLKRLFTSIGGLDTTQAIDTNTEKTRYKRRRSILKSESYNQEGIELAFHPLIPMKRYPGPTF